MNQTSVFCNREAPLTVLIVLLQGGSGKTPLHCAVEKKDYNFLHFVLNLLPADKYKEAVNVKMDTDQTCLHIAAGFSDALLPLEEHKRIVSLLLNFGADPCATLRKSGKSRPYECVFSHRQEVCKSSPYEYEFN